MNVLVTGADGFVGQHVLEALLSRGHRITGAIHRDVPSHGTLPDRLADQVRWRPFDLRDASTIDALFTGAPPDAVLHLAGLSSVSESWKDPETTFEVNATGAMRLLLAIRRLPRPSHPRVVLLISSGEVYGADGSEQDPLREDMPLRPITPYGASKAAQEMIASALGRHPGIRLIQTRSFQQIGPGQRPTFVTVDWTRQLLDIRDGVQEPVLRVGNLEIARDFLDVRDAAAGYTALLESDHAAGVYNLCSGRSCSLRQLLLLLQDIIGVSPEVRTDQRRLRPAEIRSLVGSPRRLMEETGWEARLSLEETLRTTVASLERAPAPSPMTRDAEAG